MGMPNCRNGAHGRDRGAKCAATAASWRAGCNPGGPPDMFDSKFWCPSTIISNVLNTVETFTSYTKFCMQTHLTNQAFITLATALEKYFF